jgi:hypothetical protein
MRDQAVAGTTQDRGRHIPSGRFQSCRYKRDDGMQCKANPLTGSQFCFFHDPGLDRERKAARKAGGIARTRKVMLPANLIAKSLRTGKDVAELLGETINQVRRGEIDLRVSNAIGYLSGILLSAIEKGSFEERLANLEAVVADRPNSSIAVFDEHSSFEFVQHKAD